MEIPDLGTFHYVRDLIYYEGPLLSHYRTDSGEHWLYYWCDLVDGFNRWMLVRTAERDIQYLVERRLSLDVLIPNALILPYVYIIESNNDGLHFAWKCDVDRVPDDYRPRKGTFLDMEIE